MSDFEEAFKILESSEDEEDESVSIPLSGFRDSLASLHSGQSTSDPTHTSDDPVPSSSRSVSGRTSSEGSLEQSGLSSLGSSFIPRNSAIYKAKHRSWVFTVSEERLAIHQLTREFYSDIFSKGGIAYICCGYESGPTTAYAHIQGFIRFQSPRTFESARRLLSGPMPFVHVEPAANPGKALEYCKKGGDWQEKGNIPHFSFCNRRTGDPDALSKETKIKRKIFADLQDGATTTALIAERPEQYGFILAISRFANADRVRTVPAQVLYVWGSTGLGKTTSFQSVAERLSLRYYTKSPGDRWFDGYDNQPIVLFDEFSDVSFSCYQWNGLCNPSPPLLEVKGTKFANLSSHYVVLSNRGPDDQFLGAKTQDRSAWDAYRRRLTSVHHYVETSFCTLTSIREDMVLIFNTFLSDLL